MGNLLVNQKIVRNIMKTIFKTLLFSVLVTGSTLFSSELTQLTDVSPNKVEIAWDVHDVLVKPHHWTKIVSHSCKHGGWPLAQAIGSLVFYDSVKSLFTLQMQGSWKVAKESYQIIKQGGTGDSIRHKINQYDERLGQSANGVIANMFDPMPGMANVTKELAQLGYSQRLCTNGGSGEIEIVKQSLPEVFESLEVGKTVVYQEDGTFSSKKPSLQYFTEYQDTYNPDRTKTIVFIDDKMENVIGAREAGLTAILFENAEQVRADFKTLGIPLANL